MKKHRIEVFSPEGREGWLEALFFLGVFGIIMSAVASFYPLLLAAVPFLIFIVGGLTYDYAFTSSHRKAIARYRRLDSLTQKNLEINEADLAGMSENDAETICLSLNDLLVKQRAAKAAETKPKIKSIEKSIASEIERHDNIIKELTKE